MDANATAPGDGTLDARVQTRNSNARSTFIAETKHKAGWPRHRDCILT